MVDQIINGYLRNPIKNGTGEIPGTTGELFPATRQLSPAKMAVHVAINFANNSAVDDAARELYTKVRSKVSGRRTYTPDTIIQILAAHMEAYAWYVSQVTLLNAYAASGRLHLANAEKVIGAYFTTPEMVSGIGRHFADNGKSVLYDIPLSTLRDKVAEVSRLMDICIVPQGIRDLIDLYFHKYILTTPDVKAPEAFIQPYIYRSLLEAVSLEDIDVRIGGVKELILRTPGSSVADIAQFVADAKIAGITTGKTIPYSDKPEDAFKYDKKYLTMYANLTYADSTADLGVRVDDFSNNHIYADPMVYFYGDPNKLETICGLAFDDTDPGNGNTFPDHRMRSNVLLTIGYTRFFRWRGDATGFDVTGVTSSMDCYINTSGTSTGQESYIVQAFLNLMLMTNGELDGLLPTISVQDPGANDPDHWALLPMRTDADPHCWTPTALRSKQYELLHDAIVGKMTLGKDDLKRQQGRDSKKTKY